MVRCPQPRELSTVRAEFYPIFPPSSPYRKPQQPVDSITPINNSTSPYYD